MKDLRTGVFATLKIEVSPSEMSKIHEFVEKNETKQKYNLVKENNPVSARRIKFIEIITSELKDELYKVLFKILLKINAIPEGETQVGILTTPTKTLFEFLQLIGFPIDKDDDNKMDLDEYQSL